MTIINLTQHLSTSEQAAQGVVNFAGESLARLKGLLTFESLPTREEIDARALALATLARESGAKEAMIGGAPFLMGPLEEALRLQGVTPLYAFSIRESVEKTLPDGSITKASVFRHLGFVRA